MKKISESCRLGPNAHSKPLVCLVQVSFSSMSPFPSLLISSVASAAGVKTGAAAIAEAEKKIGRRINHSLDMYRLDGIVF